eukprot:8377358-Pyramimonas_sp.AAC.1
MVPSRSWMCVSCCSRANAFSCVAPPRGPLSPLCGRNWCTVKVTLRRAEHADDTMSMSATAVGGASTIIPSNM